MKNISALFLKSLILAGTLVFTATGVANAEGEGPVAPRYGEGGIGDRALDYEEWADEEEDRQEQEGRRGDRSRRSQGAGELRYDEGYDGTGPKLEGRY
jgi:hypothetical protein